MTWKRLWDPHTPYREAGVAELTTLAAVYFVVCTVFTPLALYGVYVALTEDRLCLG